MKGNVAVDGKCNNNISHVLEEQDKDADMNSSAKVTDSVHEEFADVFFSGIWCSKAYFHFR